MLLQDALDYFGGYRSNMCRAAGHVSSHASYQWGSVVPYKAALKLQAYTKGKLKVDEQYYNGKHVKKEFKKVVQPGKTY